MACQPAIALAGETSGTVLDTQGIQISKLLVKPELLLSLNVHQREALRLAAEEKWLKRNPTFVPTSLNILEPSHVVPTRAPDKASTASLAAPKANEPREPEAHVVEIKDDRQRKKMLKATKQALAEPGGLAVPVSRSSLSPPSNRGLTRNACVAAHRKITRSRISSIGVASAEKLEYVATARCDSGCL